MSIITNKEKHDSSGGLGCFVQALAGETLTIDLQNESSVIGTVAEVDGYMNISLENVQFENKNGILLHYDNMYVRGRNIRYIHIPKQISVRQTITNFLKKSQPIRLRTKTALQFHREKKLQEKQKETRRGIVEMMQQKKASGTTTSGSN